MCKRDVRVFPSHWEKGEGRYCSRKCKGKSKQKREAINCRHCRKKMFQVPSKPRKYCSHSCHASSQIAEKHSVFRGKIAIKRGYYFVYFPEHPNTKTGRVKLSILVAEKYLKRFLKKGEHIHHINGNKLDDRPENLYVTSASEHAVIHGNDVEVNSNLIF